MPSITEQHWKAGRGSAEEKKTLVCWPPSLSLGCFSTDLSWPQWPGSSLMSLPALYPSIHLVLLQRQKKLIPVLPMNPEQGEVLWKQLFSDSGLLHTPPPSYPTAAASASCRTPRNWLGGREGWCGWAWTVQLCECLLLPAAEDKDRRICAVWAWCLKFCVGHPHPISEHVCLNPGSASCCNFVLIHTPWR